MAGTDGSDPWFAGFDPASGMLTLPLWSAAFIAALFVAFCVFVLSRARRDGLFEAFSRVGLLLVGAALAWVVLDATAAGSLTAQRRALDARFSEMTARAVAPGSALACLDATAGELVEASCEKALFASPEAAAASVTYVTAQLSLLADGSAYERRSGASYEPAMGALRHAVEADRFGIVAHVLADRDGCAAGHCEAFGLLRDANQISDNIGAHKYESYILHHASDWPQSPLSPVASNNAQAPAVTPAPAAPVPAAPPGAAPAAAATAKTSGLFFPSSASIPPVSIMTAEPSGPAPASPDTAKPAAPAARKPAPAPSTQTARKPANAAPSQSRPAPATDPAAGDQ